MCSVAKPELLKQEGYMFGESTQSCIVVPLRRPMMRLTAAEAIANVCNAVEIVVIVANVVDVGGWRKRRNEEREGFF